MAVIVHDIWRKPPEVPRLDEFTEVMEQNGLRVHLVFHELGDDLDGFWGIEIERTQRLPDGRVHLLFQRVSPKFVEMATDASWELVPWMLEEQQEHEIAKGL